MSKRILIIGTTGTGKTTFISSFKDTIEEITFKCRNANK
jgi:signal recognition particle receptor subunit beta